MLFAHIANYLLAVDLNLFVLMERPQNGCDQWQLLLLPDLWSGGSPRAFWLETPCCWYSTPQNLSPKTAGEIEAIITRTVFKLSKSDHYLKRSYGHLKLTMFHPTSLGYPLRENFMHANISCFYSIATNTS